MSTARLTARVRADRPSRRCACDPRPKTSEAIQTTSALLPDTFYASRPVPCVGFLRTTIPRVAQGEGEGYKPIPDRRGDKWARWKTHESSVFTRLFAYTDPPYFRPGAFQEFTGGCTLISGSLAVTAAHCVDALSILFADVEPVTAERVVEVCGAEATQVVAGRTGMWWHVRIEEIHRCCVEWGISERPDRVYVGAEVVLNALYHPDIAPSPDVFTVHVTDVFIPQDFRFPDSSIIPADIALLKLRRDVTADLVEDGRPAVVSSVAAAAPEGRWLVNGWGDEDMREGEEFFIPAARLKRIPMGLHSATDAARVYGDAFDTRTMLAAHGTEYADVLERGRLQLISACQGDSGSGLLCWDESIGRWRCVGVVSGGKECGEIGFPTVFARLCCL